MKNLNLLMSLICTLSLTAKAAVPAPDFDAATKTYRETLGELIKADTTNPPGNESRAVAILAARLKKEGIPYSVVEFAPGRENLVARLKGTGSQKPLMLLAHIDVVGTKDQKWSTDPHVLTEKDGFLYGRGTSDDLGSAVANLEIFLMLKRSQTPLRRDVILALTGDEESGGAGIQFLLKNHPEMVNAEIALNEGGRLVQKEDGKVAYVNLQVAEKVYQDFTLTAKGDTGHSSTPKKNNSIYRLASALDKLAHYKSEARLIPVTRAYFHERAAIEKPDIAKAMRAVADAKGSLPQAAVAKLMEDPFLASVLTTTCVATMLSGGTKVNALPPEARANINCRFLPDESVAIVHNRLAKIIQDPSIEITEEKEFGAAGASPVSGEVPTAIQEVVKAAYPGIPVIPMMATGATDSRYLRMNGVNSYGFITIAGFENDATRAHGIDERIPVASIRPGLELLHQLVLKLAAAEPIAQPK